MNRSLWLSITVVVAVAIIGSIVPCITLRKQITLESAFYPFLGLILIGMLIGAIVASIIVWLFASTIYEILTKFEYERSLTVLGLSMFPMLLIETLFTVFTLLNFSYPFFLHLFLILFLYASMIVITWRFGVNEGLPSIKALWTAGLAWISYYCFNFVCVSFVLRIFGGV